MLKFILSKLLHIVPIFIGITLVSFIFIRLLPGDPLELLTGERVMSPERYSELAALYGFDQPLWQQYLSYVTGILHGDLGISIVSRRPVISEFMPLFIATAELSLAAMIIAVTIGLPAGIIAAIKRSTPIDNSIMAGALFGYSMPIFWWGLLLIIIFSVWLGWTPVSGRISLLYYIKPVTGFMLIDSLLSGEKGAFTSALSHLVLPAIVLATIPMAVIARQTRSAMLEVLEEDYVRTAKAKGLSQFRVIAIHTLRNAMIPVITAIGLQIGMLFAGAILTETIFSWPGVGKWMIDSIARRDYPVVQGGLVLIAGVIMIVNLIIDALYGVMNPRIRYKKQT